MNRFQIQTVANLARLGFNSEECHQLLKAARTLSRWDENECNGDIERDEETGKAYRVYGHNTYHGTITRVRTADKETPAWKRVEEMAKAHQLVAVRQGDPRGVPFYICTKEQVEQGNDYRGVGVDGG